MPSKFKPAPKTLTDKSVPEAIASLEKVTVSNYRMRFAALKVLFGASNKLKSTDKRPEVQTWVTDVLKVAEAEKKLTEAHEKAMDQGLDDGTSRRPSQASKYAGNPEVQKAYNQGYKDGAARPDPAQLRARP